MITPFGLRHVWLMRQLQSGSSSLAIPACLLEEQTTPLRRALRGYFLRPTAGISTYVLLATDQVPPLRGFVQANVRRPTLPWPSRRCGLAWDVSHIAPLLDDSEDTATVWYRLLLHLCIAAGEQGVQRLFARLPEESTTESESRPFSGEAESRLYSGEDVFRQAGFSVYCHERVFERPSGPWDGSLSPAAVAVQEADQWELQKLWTRALPRSVAHAEECNNLAGRAKTFELAFSGVEQGYVLRRPAGEACGYVYMLQRPRGVWIRLLADPEMPGGFGEMLDHAAAVLENQSPRPVYCPVRDYETGLAGALEARGFRPQTGYSLLVKHTTVQVKEARRKLVPALEKRAEVAPTVSHSTDSLIRRWEHEPSGCKRD